MPNVSATTAPVRAHVEGRQLGVDPVDAAHPGQRVGARRRPASAMPSLANSVIITNTCLAPMARSIAPPTAGIASGAPVCQLARSPPAETWKAPSTQTSRWPPRIIANESAWWKYDAPGSSVTGILPALVRSGSISSPTRGRAHAEHAVLGVQHDAGARREVVGDQGGLADAEVHEGAGRDVAGDERGHLVLAERPAVEVRRSHAAASARHHPVDVDAGRHDDLGVELADLDDPRHLRRSSSSAAVAITGPKLRAVLR